ncbi:LuxR C-terminal-related transcriptional regulator [Elongatibacter sediminis]|uniref:LuxR C-terminal-related transcriptional regulator n=1 Tax=Elongatibacter sediminis TaxID=3119006 RepID=A0AAW9R6J4_9GAMM
MKPATATDKPALFPVWLLHSKTSPTRQRVDLLERPSLTLKLHQALDATVSVIHAPAGYGKSTLLSNWRDLLLAEGHTVCWLSLDRQDNEALHLLIYIAFSLVEGGVAFDSDSAGFDRTVSELSERDLLSLIIHWAAEHPNQVVLILDDFDHLKAEVIDSVIHPLLEYAPDNLHIAIATRDDSHLKVSSLEVKGQAVRFGASQLRFTPMELNDFLADELDNQTIQKLFKVTEGWPVAIQMIRSAVQSEKDVERIMDDLTGDATNIASYLSEEILSNLDEGLRDFLMDISLVDRIDTEFADYLRGQPGSHVLLGRARVLDTLVLPVDTMDGTFRLHPLFREHLYERLAASRPDRLKTLHLSAADWFSSREDLVEAVRHCVLAGEPEHAIGIIQRVGGVMIWFREGLTRLRAVMRLLEDQAVFDDWRLAMIRCLLYIKDGQVHQARQLYDSVTARADIEFAGLSQLGADDQVDEFAILEMGISIYEGKPISQASCRQLEARVASLDEKEFAIRGNLLTFLCVGYLQRGEFSEARRYGELAIPAFMAAGSLYGTAYIHFHLGDISFAEGNSEDAARSYAEGLDLARKHFNDDQGMKLVGSILTSELNYELGDVGSIPAIARSIPKLLERHEAWFDIYAAGYSASCHRELDDYGIDAALAIVDRAVEYAELNRLFRLTRLLACLRIELLLRADKISEARSVLQHSGITIGDYMSEAEDQIAWRERDTAVAAISHLLICEGRLEEALDQLRHFSRQARHAGHMRARMKYQLLLAIAHGHRDDATARDHHLESALELYERSRYVRPFLEHQPELKVALTAYLSETAQSTGARHHESAQQILERLEDARTKDVEEALLSPREQEVLQELMQGFSNKVIARKINVSESTVRFHLRNIFVKLNVTSRLQAVTVARQQKLV